MAFNFKIKNLSISEVILYVLFIITVAWIIGVIIFILTFQNVELSLKVDRLISPQRYVKIQKFKPVITTNNSPIESVDPNTERIESLLENFNNSIDGDVSVYYKNLNTDTEIILNPNTKYYMASLYKIILALYLLEKVDSGELNLDSNIGTQSATLDSALEKVITESNNPLAQFLANKYGWLKIEKEIENNLDLEFSFDSKLQIDVVNAGKLLNSIESKNNISENSSSYLLNLMENQTLVTKIPKYLPNDTRVLNKTGEFETYSHDAAIIYSDTADYILIVLTKSDDPKLTDEKIATLSKDIFEVLNPNYFDNFNAN